MEYYREDTNNKKAQPGKVGLFVPNVSYLSSIIFLNL